MTDHVTPSTPRLSRRSALKLAGTAAMAAGASAALLAARRDAYAALADNQRAFVDLRFGMFMHFNMGTFHDAEWVDPGQDPLTFNPAQLDCGQWADAAKSAGMTFAVLTAKHHDGFCLWPSAQTGYTVAGSSVKQDVVRLYVDAFRARGLTPGLYFSIWDRQQGVASGSVTRADIDFVKAQLTELLTGYGDIAVLALDGWAWQMGHQEVPYGEIRAHIKTLQPACLIMDINGVTEPWDTDIVFFEEPKGVWAPAGNTYAGCQGQNIVSTGWFWHPTTPSATPMSVSDIVTTHLKTLEPRYTNLLLNCPPNNLGLLDANIVARLAEVGAAWAPDSGRASLPAQPDTIAWPVSAAAATATSGTAGNAVDGRNDSGYQTLWQSSTALPQSVTVDLGAAYSNIDMLTYLPTQDGSSTGAITGYRILVSIDGSVFTQVTTGTWPASKALKQARFTPQTTRYVRLEATAAASGYALANEILVGGYAARPLTGSATPTVAPSTSGSSPSTSPPTSTPTSASPGTSSGTGEITATYRTVNSWQGGFQGEVAVAAGGTAISGWSVSWALAAGQSISQLWNGTFTTSGSAVTVKNASWNGTLAANATTTFGFLATGSPSTPNLTVTSP